MASNNRNPGSWFSRSNGNRNWNVFGSRLRLEMLEERTLLAGITAVDLADEIAQKADRQAEVLVEGVPMVGGANGMYFDLENNLYVANAWGRTITKMDPETGEILQRLGSGDSVLFPDDLIVDDDGSLYWTDPGLGAVFRRLPDGTTFPVATGFPFANPITISDDGRLFFAQCFESESNGIFEADPNGTSAPTTIRDGDVGCASNGMDWWDGALFGPRLFEGRIVRVDVDTGDLTDVTTGWGFPSAVKFNSHGELHAVNPGNGELAKIDVATGDREVIAQFPFAWSDNLAFDANDRLYVSSATDGAVLEVLPNGSLRTVSPGGMIVPMGLAQIDGTLYVGEPQAIRGFDAKTGDPVSVTRSLFGIGPALFTTGVSAVDDQLIVMSWFTGQLMIWDPVSGSAVLDTLFALPMDAESFQGDLLVTELGTGSVVRASLPDLTVRETVASGFIVPVGLAVHDDDAYVSDAAQGTVFQIIRDGEVLDIPDPVATGLALPEGITLRSGGNRLLVVEGATNSLKDIHLKSGKVKTIGKDLGFQQAVPGFPPTAFINDVEVGPNGTIYVNSDGANVIFKIGDEKVSGKRNDDLPSIFAAAAIVPDTAASDASSTDKTGDATAAAGIFSRLTDAAHGPPLQPAQGASGTKIDFRRSDLVLSSPALSDPAMLDELLLGELARALVGIELDLMDRLL